jgi:nicotinamide mononucleotide adenylyltransferase
LDHILGRYGVFIVERAGSDVDEALESLSQWRDNIFVLRQMIHNDVSSTKIRLFLRRGMSVHYLLPAAVVNYIEANHLYADDSTTAASSSDKPEAKLDTTQKLSAAGSSS